MHRLYGFEVLLDDVLEVTAALVDVAQHTAQDALVGIGLDKDLDIKQIAQALILQDQDTLDDDDAARLDDRRLFGARMLGKISSVSCSMSRSVSKDFGWS